MSNLPNKKIQGFVSFLPLLIITLLLVSGFVIYSQGKNTTTVSESVLSESDGQGKDSGTSGKTENETENDHDENETPEAVETHEPDETPEPEEFEEESEIEVKEGEIESKIKIRNGINKFEFQQEGAGFSVESDFPLSVNPDTRELTVDTPSGSRIVAILPQQAVDNMLAAGIVTTTTEINLKTESDGSLSYDIHGLKDEKLLGIFDVALQKNLIISAQTGQILAVNQSIFSKILDLLSI